MIKLSGVSNCPCVVVMGLSRLLAEKSIFISRVEGQIALHISRLGNKGPGLDDSRRQICQFLNKYQLRTMKHKLG